MLDTATDMKKLPIGISTLSSILNDGCVYVDKTALIHQLVTTGRYHFLSRPRRFGKSLLIDTLKELFEGNEPLFQGLAIHPNGIGRKNTLSSTSVSTTVCIPTGRTWMPSFWGNSKRMPNG